jgi:hypothetical protein
LNKINLYIIDTSQPVYLNQCLKSLKETTSPKNYFLTIVPELEIREKTLNSILSKSNKEDVLVVADDVVFTPGWYDSLVRFYVEGDIIGFSNLYPNTDTVQDTGYDLVVIDAAVSTEARNRGQKVDDIEIADFSPCDTVMGCAMLIKSRVIKSGLLFRAEGANRWGEILFCHEAKKMSFKVIVLGHTLYHYGKSTKNNSDLKYRTESYLYEKELWEKNVQKYIDINLVNKKKEIVLSESIVSLFEKQKNIVLWGAGTVTQRLLRTINDRIDSSQVSICSGLKEESGLLLEGFSVNYNKDVDFKDSQIILITVIGKHEMIIKQLEERLLKFVIYYISETRTDSKIFYSVMKYEKL